MCVFVCQNDCVWFVFRCWWWLVGRLVVPHRSLHDDSMLLDFASWMQCPGTGVMWRAMRGNVTRPISHANVCVSGGMVLVWLWVVCLHVCMILITLTLKWFHGFAFACTSIFESS